MSKGQGYVAIGALWLILANLQTGWLSALTALVGLFSIVVGSIMIASND